MCRKVFSKIFRDEMTKIPSLSFKQILECEHPQAYTLFIDGGYPRLQLPETYDDFSALARYMYMLGIYYNKDLVGCLTLHYDMDHPLGLGFDAVVLPEYRKVWGSKALFKELFDTAFCDFVGTHYMYAIARNEKAERGLKNLGFVKYSKYKGAVEYRLDFKNIKPNLRGNKCLARLKQLQAV